jgi:hypothetical protein
MEQRTDDTQVVLVEFGDAGGFRISGGRVIPIPPLEPGLRARLRAAGALLQAAELAQDERLATLAREVSGPAHSAVLQAAESGAGSVIVQGTSGGFQLGAGDEGGDGDGTGELPIWVRRILIPIPPIPEEERRVVEIAEEIPEIERAD